jgi:hypothetical protein
MAEQMPNLQFSILRNIPEELENPHRPLPPLPQALLLHQVLF